MGDHQHSCHTQFTTFDNDCFYCNGVTLPFLSHKLSRVLVFTSITSSLISAWIASEFINCYQGLKCYMNTSTTNASVHVSENLKLS